MNFVVGLQVFHEKTTLQYFENIISGINLYNKKSISRSLIIFIQPRKMANDFLNNYIFVHTFQWTSSELYNNITITVKIAMVTYRQRKNI